MSKSGDMDAVEMRWNGPAMWPRPGLMAGQHMRAISCPFNTLPIILEDEREYEVDEVSLRQDSKAVLRSISEQHPSANHTRDILAMVSNELDKASEASNNLHVRHHSQTHGRVKQWNVKPQCMEADADPNLGKAGKSNEIVIEEVDAGLEGSWQGLNLQPSRRQSKHRLVYWRRKSTILEE